MLALFGWMGMARLIRGEVLSLREREFVQAARVLGMPTRRILFKELLPNLAAPIVISVSLMLPAFVAAEAGLAFLGIGVTDGASWGRTINFAIPYFERLPALPVGAPDRHRAARARPQPPRRRDPRRPGPQDSSLTTGPRRRTLPTAPRRGHEHG